MDFDEAEARFRWLEAQRAANNLDEADYYDELNQVRVTDRFGRLWMMQASSGVWHVNDGKRWVVSDPSETTTLSLVALEEASEDPAEADDGPVYGLVYLVLYLFTWLATVLVVLVVIGLFVAPPARHIAAVGVGVLALAALVALSVLLFNGNWRGEITELKTFAAKPGDGAARPGTAGRTIAYVRDANGRTRKVRAMPGWTAGDALVKRPGERRIRRVAGK